jgi:hypothetical protein
MNQIEINELHKIIEDHCNIKGYTVAQILAFLSLTFIGTLIINGYSEEFVDKTAERMKVKFREKKQQMNYDR